MSRKTSLNISRVFCAGLALAAIVVSLGAQSATAASADHRRLGKPLPHRHHFYAMYRGPSFAPPAALPHAPEYGFLRRVPANASRASAFWRVMRLANELMHERVSR
jgi:hypothetical protein